ncbi:hypothetical protein HG536_0B06410 [Torulaspora globosa]|uniref:Efficient mitochondria targeting-associated protein 19 n=1 Tax=Torulaspora globosa TaxID=48254 RepID=A0A7G3ZE37_9SACH|nr:uncharacterized protein HG536_0B06410 [Torulaspora globosa]QLL31773.1 hypothetical protein HG536_0B06410 [Torulaspora globosa]
MPKLQGFQRSLYYYYFLLHIPITLLIDSQVVIPERYHPASALFRWHIAQNNDFLLQEKPTWLYNFVLIELVLQLPLFFYFANGLRPTQATTDQTKLAKAAASSKEKNLYRWLRIYGWNASLSTLICMITIYQRGYYPSTPLVPLVYEDKIRLILVYLPTFLLPLRLCLL